MWIKVYQKWGYFTQKLKQYQYFSWISKSLCSGNSSALAMELPQSYGAKSSIQYSLNGNVQPLCIPPDVYHGLLVSGVRFRVIVITHSYRKIINQRSLFFSRKNKYIIPLMTVFDIDNDVNFRNPTSRNICFGFYQDDSKVRSENFQIMQDFMKILCLIGY